MASDTAEPVLVLSLLSAVFAPLQGFFNGIAYGLTPNIKEVQCVLSAPLVSLKDCVGAGRVVGSTGLLLVQKISCERVRHCYCVSCPCQLFDIFSALPKV